MGIIEFEYMKKNKAVARIRADIEKDTAEKEIYGNDEFDDPIPKDKIKIKDILEFFEDRCFPRGRIDERSILKELGLTTYNPYGIVRVTRGLSPDDYYWIKFKDDNVEYEDIKIRD